MRDAWTSSVDKQIAILAETLNRTVAILERMDERVKNVVTDVSELRAEVRGKPDRMLTWLSEGGGCIGQAVTILLSLGALGVSFSSLLWIVLHK